MEARGRGEATPHASDASTRRTFKNILFEGKGARLEDGTSPGTAPNTHACCLPLDAQSNKIGEVRGGASPGTSPASDAPPQKRARVHGGISPGTLPANAALENCANVQDGISLGTSPKNSAQNASTRLRGAWRHFARHFASQ